MGILYRYLSATIIKTILLVLLMLTGLELFILFAGELGDIGSGNYTLYHAAQYALFMLPQSIYHLFPMAALLGTLLGLGLLASHSELIVMRAAGVSITQITLIIVATAAMLVLFMGGLGEGLGPNAAKKAMQIKAMAISRGQTLTTQQGTWVRNKNEFIRIDAVMPGRHLSGVTLYRFDEQHRLIENAAAESASYTNHRWHLNAVRVTTLTPKKTMVKTYNTLPWDVHLTPKMLVMDRLSPNQMSLRRLHQTIRYRQQSGLRTGQYQLVFWQRIMQPLATAVMMLLAIPFIFGPLRNVTMGLRIMTGVIVGFSFYILNQFFGPTSLVYQFPPLIAALLPTLLFALLGVWLLRRLR